MNKSSISGTVMLTAVVAWTCGVGGVVVGIALLTHTGHGGCSNWFGIGADCGSQPHSTAGTGLLCILAGPLLAVVFGALSRIASAVDQTHTAVLRNADLLTKSASGR